MEALGMVRTTIPTPRRGLFTREPHDLPSQSNYEGKTQAVTCGGR
jgi:hypothetical protein